MTGDAPNPLPPSGAPDFGTDLTHHVATVNEVNIHFVTAGQGDPVLLLHGWPQTWLAWRRLIELLRDEFTLIAPDLRGLGDSQKPTGSFDLLDAATDMRALIDHLGYEQVRVVGHDLGGLVSYALTRLHPERVPQLVCADTPLPLLGVPLPGWEHIERRLWHWAFHAAPDVPEALISGRERLYMEWFFKNGTYNPAAIPPADVDEYVRCYSAPGGLRAGFAYSRTRPEAADRLRELTGDAKLEMPVMGLGGALTLRDMVRKAFEQVAVDVHGGAIPHCGHWIPDERPEWLAEELRGFFAAA